MKTLLQNLLIFLALCLCGLIAFQWHRETKLRQEIQTLNDTIHDKLEALQNQQAVLKRNDEEIKRLDGLKNDLTETVKSNRVEIARVTKDLDRSDNEVQKGLDTIKKFKAALEEANANITAQNTKITAQNEAVARQNEELKKLSDVAVKYNKLVADFNELAQKWNDAQAAAATNAAPKK